MTAMLGTLGPPALARNRPEVEILCPPPGGGRSLRRGICRRVCGATLGVLVSEATAAQGLFVTRRRPGVLVDAVIAVLAFAGSLAVLSGASSASHGLDPYSVVLAAFASLPLLAWRRSPLGVFVLTTAASAVSLGAGYQPGPPLGPTAALFLLAASRDQTHPWTRRTTAVVGSLLAIHVGALGLASGSFPGTALLAAVLLWGIAWFAGERTRLRRSEIAELKQRAARGERDAQRERRLAAAEERTRIARDLHDSAGHAINVIGVQAGAARLLQESDPARSREALQRIEDVARQTVGEIDRIVHVLREQDPSESDERTGAPGLGALETLVTHHAAAGCRVSVVTEGEPRPLAGAVEEAAYRLLQEALTNAARHGAGGARVHVGFRPSALELTVENPTRISEATSSNGGHGLIGMRERVALVGGSLAAERGYGDFRVHAQLPYQYERDNARPDR
jgi:signal transduction histidine kinase